jgi:CheY-like chemotaxis protein
VGTSLEKQPTGPANRSNPMSLPQPTILIVDDHPDIQTLLKTAFEHFGYQTLCAGNSADAYQLICDKPVDLAIIDQLLPDSSGIELGKKIRQLKHCQKTPLVLFSGAINAGVELASIKAGFDLCLTKPVSIKRLHEIADKLISQ